MNSFLRVVRPFTSRSSYSRTFGVISLLLITLTIPLTVFLTQRQQDIRRQAQETQSRSEAGYDGESWQKHSAVEFVSNEFLVKFKPAVAQELRSRAETAPNEQLKETGNRDLDQINKKIQVDKIEKIFKKSLKEIPRKDQQAGLTKDDYNRWFKVSLPIPKKVFKTNKSSTPLINSAQQGMGPDLISLMRDPDFRQLLAAISAYKKSSDVEKVEFNFMYHLLQVSATPSTNSSPAQIPNDYYFNSATNELWGLKKINVQESWSKTTGSKSVLVAISDSGVDYSHPDLADNIWSNPGETGGGKENNGIDDDSNGYIDDFRGWDFGDRDNDPMDEYGHGSHVAGTIGATGNNDFDNSQDTGKRIVGINHTVALMPIKSIDKNQSLLTSYLVEGIYYAVRNGASVINMSWGGPSKSQILEDALAFAHSNNVVLVAAAGNSTTDAMYDQPANSPYVITVAASNEYDEPSCFSNYGSKVDAAAPGGDVVRCNGRGMQILSARSVKALTSILPSFGSSYYAFAAGTSMAAPHVAGTAALIKHLHPDFTNEEIRHVLRNSGDSMVTHLNFGYGRLNAGKAVSITSPPPVANLLSPYHDTVVSTASVAVKGTVSARGQQLSWILEMGEGEKPANWVKVAEGSQELNNLVLGEAILDSFSSGKFSLRLRATSNGVVSEDKVVFNYDKEIVVGWPKDYDTETIYSTEPAVADLNGDGKQDLIVTGTLFDAKVYAWQSDGSALPGWPAQLPEAFNYSPAVADLDGDNKPEVVVASFGLGSYSALSILKSDGQPYSPAWPKKFTTYFFNTPALADLNGDGKKEIILRNCGLHVFDLSGTELPGWPVYVEGYTKGASCTDIFNSPTVADLDGDGSNEIVVYWQPASSDISTAPLPELRAYNNTGGLLWRVTVPFAFSPTISPATLDINNDGRLEIALQTAKLTNCSQPPYLPSCFTKYIYVLQADGSNYPGFPKSYPNEDTQIIHLIAADLNNDGRTELVGGDGEHLHVYDSSGEELTTWRAPYGSVLGTPTIGDTDGDRKLEILTAADGAYTTNRGIYIIKEGMGPIWKKEYGIGYTSPIAGDFDGNGTVEVAGILNKYFLNKLYIWKLPGTLLRRGYAFWPQYGFSPQHTREFTFALYGTGSDSDWDDWSNSTERFIGTDPLMSCPAVSTSNAWPPDFDNNRLINILDFSKFRIYMNTQEGDGKYSRRYDLNADRKINIADYAIFQKYFGKKCN